MSGVAPDGPPLPFGADNSDGARLVAEAAHELRAPIAALLAAAETLDGRWEQLTDDDRRRLAGVVLSRGRQLSDLVVELLDQSRQAAAGAAGRARILAVAPRIHSAIEEAAVPGVVVSCPEESAVTVVPDHLRRMLVNLLVNARQHGLPPVRVEVGSDGRQVEIRVIDAGPGVPTELVPRLFEPFSRAAPSNPDRTTGGAGLGLAIVDALATGSGGHAFYRPPPSGGAIFGVRLPAG